MNRGVAVLGAAWGTLGVFALLLFAIYRLAWRAVEGWRYGLSDWQLAIAVLTIVFMAYSEGYRGFQRSFSPRTAARIRYLRDRPDPMRTLLAPLVAMGFLHARRGTRVKACAMFVGVLALVLLVHRLPQPWRGIVDAGVVVGLAWGVVSLAFSTVQALSRESFDVSPEVPPGC